MNAPMVTYFLWDGFDDLLYFPDSGRNQLSSGSILNMAGSKSYSIVEYFGGDDGHRCGYCKNERGNFSHGKCFNY